MTESDLKYRQPLPSALPTGKYEPQMSFGEMADIISHNQPWLDRDEVMRDVFHEQQRQRLWNGYGV